MKKMNEKITIRIDTETLNKYKDLANRNQRKLAD